MTKKAKTQKKSLPSACKALIKVAAGIAIIAGTSGLVFGLTAGLILLCKMNRHDSQHQKMNQ